MNITNKLTLRTLKENKRRTLVTILGVIISVAMITAVSTLVVSFMNLMQRQEIANNGEWHVLYNNVNKEQLQAIQEDSETKTMIISRDVGYAILDGSENEFKPYLFIKEYNEEGFKHFPIHLKEGRLPKSSDEVVISEHIETNGNVQYKIGDVLTIDVGQRMILDENGIEQILGQNSDLIRVNGVIQEQLINLNKRNYKIVGVIERPDFEYPWAPGYTVISYVGSETISDEDQVNASVIVKKINYGIFQRAEELKEKLGIEEVSFNNSLLRYYGITNDGNFSATLYSLASILIIVIMVGSISLIYNAFAISVSERSRYLGMLSSVGATKKQKRNSVLFEGVVIGAISIPIGIIAGLVGIGITLFYINTLLESALGLEEDLVMVFTPSSIIVSILVSALTILISTWIPAIRASKISAIDAIRQTKDVKLTRKAVKTSKFVRKLFGIEAEIGLKNLKRNKRKYQATVFSLVISIVLFLTVSFFTQNLQNSLKMTQLGPNYDLSVNLVNKTNKVEVFNRIKNMNEVTEISRIKYSYLSTLVEQSKLPNSLLEEIKEYPEILENGKYRYHVSLYALDDETLKSYAEKVGASFEKLKQTDQLSGILINENYYQDANAKKYVSSEAIGPVDSITFEVESKDTEEWETLDSVKIIKRTTEIPMGIQVETLPGMINMIVSEEVFDKIRNSSPTLMEYLNEEIILKSSDPLKTEEEIHDLQLDDVYVYNVYQSRKSDEQMTLMLGVFVYGFIILITAITIANIFNTVSTSIALRKREFAMLKSVGMTPKGFNKMLNYESAFYGIKSLLYGLPISLLVMYLIYRSMQYTFNYGFFIPWFSIGIVVVAVFVIVGSVMLYSSSKVKKENIIDALKQENI